MVGAKPLASLSSGLLARKGEARPAMRPQRIDFAASQHDDLGWNDMGEGAPVPPVLVERATLTREIQGDPAPAASLPPLAAAAIARESAAATRGRRTAFTLRLDADRHLRLRLAAAVAGRSAQQVVTQALDAYLSQQSGLDAIVDGLPDPLARK